LISFTKASTDSSTSCCVKLRKGKVETIAPSLRNAFAESYSEFVPGKIGINTFGLSTL